MPSPASPARRVFDRLTPDESVALGEILRRETTGGILLVIAAIAAMVWANSPVSESYASLRSISFGVPGVVELDLAHWASEGLLAVFFLVAGLELKREFVTGDLADRREAALPVAVAVAGMVVPAAVFIIVVLPLGGTTSGWPIPMATDIAFALAVLALAGQGLPTALRAFLLSLAVVDDLLAILVIAVFFTERVAVGPLIGAIVLLVAYAALERLRVHAWWLYVPIGLGTWWLMHEAGIHATVAGVALGLLTRAHRDSGELRSPVERLEHKLRPLSALVCVPVFALLASGVPLSAEALTGLASSPVAVGVTAGLLIGKVAGVTGGTWLVARLTRAQLSSQLGWSDVAAVGLLSGIGFTVSLLFSELSFPGDPGSVETAKSAVLVSSALSGVLAAAALRRRRARQSP